MSTNEFSEILTEVLQRWSAEGIARPGARREQLILVERRYGIRLPDDMVSLFLLADGMGDNEMDDLLMRFWPVSELYPAVEEVPERDQQDYDGFFIFADYSLWAHAYAIRCIEAEDRGTVVIVGASQPIPVASSFAEFMSNYMRHPDRLFKAQSGVPAPG